MTLGIFRHFPSFLSDKNRKLPPTGNCLKIFNICNVSIYHEEIPSFVDIICNVLFLQCLGFIHMFPHHGHPIANAVRLPSPTRNTWCPSIRVFTGKLRTIIIRRCEREKLTICNVQRMAADLAFTILSNTFVVSLLTSFVYPT